MVSLDAVTKEIQCPEEQENAEAPEDAEIINKEDIEISEADAKLEVSHKSASDIYVDDNHLIVSGNENGADHAISANVCGVNPNVNSKSLPNVNEDVDCIGEANIEGRRIVDVDFLLKELHRTFDNHAKKTRCHFRDWKLVKTHRRGFLSQLFFRCQTCFHTDNIWSEPERAENLDINSGAIVGSLVVELGFAQLEELCASMKVQCMSEKTYIKYREDVVDQYSAAALTQMKLAGEAENVLAIKRGDIHQGVPYILVVVDGSWMKRTYGTNFDSLSGVDAIVGYHTRKVLFVGIRNKFCTI